MGCHDYKAIYRGYNQITPFLTGRGPACAKQNLNKNMRLMDKRWGAHHFSSR